MTIRFPTTDSVVFLVGAGLAGAAAIAQAQSIGDLQGSSHISPFVNSSVGNIAGIVTALDNVGFWMQDSGDGNALTSDGIYVFLGGASKPIVGDAVSVTGWVQEFRPAAGNLTTTEINATSGFSGSWTTTSTGNALPVATVIGTGHLPPSAIAPNVGNVETAPGYQLQPQQYSMDFYESLEGMRASLPAAVAVAPRNNFGEIPVVASVQIGAPGMIAVPRGGVVVAPGQFNGHRLYIDDKLTTTPNVNSGAQLEGVVGVLDYSFSNYKLYLTQSATVVSNDLTRESASIDPGRFGLASYNVRNLGGDASATRMQTIAGQIKNTLGAPSLIALQEIQDDNGTTDNGVVTADLTLDRLTTELSLQTGRNYQFVAVNPVDGADGGQPGGNIRQAFLYDTSRASFSGVVGGPLDSVTAVAGPGGQIQFNFGAGRIDPTNSAFDNSRKPLVGEFLVDGQQLIVVSNHFNSKGGDDRLYGPNQEPQRPSDVLRRKQAQAVGSFVQGLLAINPDANIVITGDMNDFQFASTLQPLADAGLTNLTDLLPLEERYNYNFEGNLEALDHMFVSANLLAKGELAYDIVHANAEFVDQVSDHDPLLLMMNVAAVPEPNAYVLMLAGLGLLGTVARPRRNAAV